MQNEKKPETRFSDLPDAELLARLLGFASRRTPEERKKTADDLLALFDGLYGVLRASVPELSRAGLGEGETVLIKTVLPVYIRSLVTAIPENLCCDTIEILADAVTRRFVCAGEEQIWLFLLDREDKLLYSGKLAEGVVNTASVEPRAVVETALFRGAASAVLAHNHPSGNLRPSADDEMTTSILCDALRTVGIPLTEHLIVSGRKWLPLLLYSDRLDCTRPLSYYGEKTVAEVRCFREKSMGSLKR